MKELMDHIELLKWAEQLSSFDYDTSDERFITIAELYTPYNYSSEVGSLSPDDLDPTSEINLKALRLQEVWEKYQKMSSLDIMKIRSRMTKHLRAMIGDKERDKDWNAKVKHKLKRIKRWL